MDQRRLEGLDPQQLEQHRAWLLRLAVAILRDADLAEDCVQDVFLTALRRGPTRPEASASVRAWLKRVLVNRARKSMDREAQRRHCELLALSENARTPGREPLAFRELQSELYRSVRALDERYRRVVILRHERNLTPSEIADRLDVPTKTVNSWLYRAYGKLRERLDGRFERLGGFAPVLLGALREIGARGDVSTVALEAARGVGGARPAIERVPLAPAFALRAVLVLGLVAAIALLLQMRGEPGELAANLSHAVVADVARSSRAVEGLPAPTPEHERALAVRQEGEPLEPESAPVASVEARWIGRVVAADGVPVAGVPVRFEPLTGDDPLLFSDRGSSGLEELYQRFDRGFEPELDAASGSEASTLSAADGSFELAAPTGKGWIAVASDAWSIVTTSVVLELPPPGDPRVCIAPARRVSGRVLDGDGRPVRSARVELRLPERFLAAQTGSPTSIAHEPSTFTDADGLFAFERAPDIADAHLRFLANGYDAKELPLGERGVAEDELEIELRAEASALVVVGRAVDAQGAPVAGAFVSLDWTSTATSDGEGLFRLCVAEGSPAARTSSATLRAAARGFQPLEQVVQARERAWPRVELVFRAPALDVTGIVLRADGMPHARAAVWVPSPELLGAPQGSRPPIFAEHVMSGPQDGGSLEATITNAEGVFRLLGLQDQAYVLRVADLDTREWFETEPVRAGVVGAVFEFAPDGCFPEVRGVVVGRDGAPVRGARIARSYPRLDARMHDGRRFVSRFSGDAVAADDEGRFVLADVARRGGVLTVSGAAIQMRHVELERELGAGADPLALRLVVGRSCRVVVERAGLAFDRFSFQNPGGGYVEFMAAVQGVAPALQHASIDGERSDEYLVTDLASELVLWSGAREVARVPLALRADGLNVLRP